MAVFRIAPLAAAIVALGIAGSAGAAEISGAGATFPYPIYAKWAEAYNAKTGVKLNYQSIGSVAASRRSLPGRWISALRICR